MTSLVNGAVELRPSHLDERRRQAGLVLKALEGQEDALNDQLGSGSLFPQQYGEAIQDLQKQRVEANALLTELDGWTYLAKLVVIKEGPGAGTARLVPISMIWASITPSDQRRLIRAVFPDLRLVGLESKDFCWNQPTVGRYIGVQVPQAHPDQGNAGLVSALTKLLIHHPGFDLKKGNAQVTLGPPEMQGD